MMPVALIASRRWGVVACSSSAAARASTASAVTCSGPQRPAESASISSRTPAVAPRRQSVTSGSGCVFSHSATAGSFKQLGDGGNALQQVLLRFRCHSRPLLQPRFGPAVDDIRGARKKRPVTDAKEVGVGNPAGRNVLSPDCSLCLIRGVLLQHFSCYSFAIFCRYQAGPPRTPLLPVAHLGEGAWRNRIEKGRFSLLNRPSKQKPNKTDRLTTSVASHTNPPRSTPGVAKTRPGIFPGSQPLPCSQLSIYPFANGLMIEPGKPVEQALEVVLDQQRFKVLAVSGNAGCACEPGTRSEGRKTPPRSAARPACGGGRAAAR